MQHMRRDPNRAAPEGQHGPASEQDAGLPLRPSESRRHRLRQLRAFCHVARLGSISKAAERIFSSQPTVSIQVRALEEELDVALVERNGPNITLTPAGKDFYRLAVHLVEDIDRLPDTFAEQFHRVAVDIHIAAGETAAAVLLPQYLRRFSEQQPDTRVNVRTGSGRDCLRWLRAFEVDLVIAAMDVEPPDLRFHPVVSSELVLITPEVHPLAERESASLEDLSAYPVISHTAGMHVRQFGEMFLHQHRVPIRLVVEIDGWDGIKAYVEAGFGIAVVPELCLDKRDRVCRIPLETFIPPRRYGAITRREGTLPMAVRTIIGIMDPNLRDEY